MDDLPDNIFLRFHSRFDQVRPVVSHLDFFLLYKPLIPKKIGEYPKGPQKQLLKEDIFVKYEENKSVSLLLDPIPIKYLPDGKKFLCSLIAPSIK